MDTARLRRIEEICDVALQLDRRDREMYVDQVCGVDETLRCEVESLLGFERVAERFMEVPAFFLLDWADLEAKVGPHAPIVPSQELGRYQIKAVLGEGGMGVVYRAVDTRLGREVALKVLPPALSRDSSAFERFKREAYATSALSHPNICTVHDFGEYEGQPFLVLELLRGRSLKDRLQIGRLALGELLKFAVQLTDALDAAHGKGIIHRDIKPANIFLTDDGRCRLADQLQEIYPGRLTSDGANSTSPLKVQAGWRYPLHARVSPPEPLTTSPTRARNQTRRSLGGSPAGPVSNGATADCRVPKKCKTLG